MLENNNLAKNSRTLNMNVNVTQPLNEKQKKDNSIIGRRISNNIELNQNNTRLTFN